MSFDSHLIHRCTIQRATRTEDAYHNVTETWADVATNVACRFVEKRKPVLVDEGTERSVVVSYLLLVHGDVDLRERDRVSEVTFEDGTKREGKFVLDIAPLARRGRAMRHKSAVLSLVS